MWRFGPLFWHVFTYVGWKIPHCWTSLSMKKRGKRLPSPRMMIWMCFWQSFFRGPFCWGGWESWGKENLWKRSEIRFGKSWNSSSGEWSLLTQRAWTSWKHDSSGAGGGTTPYKLIGGFLADSFVAMVLRIVRNILVIREVSREHSRYSQNELEHLNIIQEYPPRSAFTTCSEDCHGRSGGIWGALKIMLFR